MASFLNTLLPLGWTRISGGPKFNNTRVGRPGRWQVEQNDPYAIWEFQVSYLRSDYETAPELTIDNLYSFWLNSGAAYCFKVDDLMDNTVSANVGSGVIAQVNGVWRLMKQYDSGYLHPITRPKSDVVVNAGTLDFNTGIVSGISAAGSWTGGFYRPMIFLEDSLKYDFAPNGEQNLTLALQEQLEI